MIEQYTSPVAVNNSQEPWLVGEGVVVSGGVAIPSLDFNFITDGLPGTVTFTRGSNATQFDSSGNLVYAPANLLPRSEEFSDASWTKSGATVTADSTTAPSGTATADTLTEDTSTGQHRVYRSVSGTTNTNPYTYSFFAKASTRTRVYIGLAEGATFVRQGNAVFDLSAGTVVSASTGSGGATGGSATIQNVGDGWYRCTYTLTLGGTDTSIFGDINLVSTGTTISYTGNGTGAIFIWGAQLNPTPMQGGVTASLSTYYPTTASAYYGPRFDYNPTTLAARGLLIEEQRTNSIRNNTMQGAVAGTPGTVPTNWVLTGAGGNITSLETVSVGTENGIAYIDVRYVFSGAATANVRHEAVNQIAATSTQTWTASAFVKLIGGSTSNITTNIVITQYNSSFAALEATSVPFTPLTTALGTSRPNNTKATTQATVASVTSAVSIVASGAADITLRIGLPQLELGAFATSVIPTTTTALTRSADVASVNTLSPWFNATEGALFVEASPQTSNVVAFSLIDFNNTTTSNRISLAKAITSGNASLFVNDTASAQCNISSATWTATGKLAGAYAANDFATSYNGATPATDTSGTVPSVTRMQIGVRADGGNQLTGHIRRITYYPRRLSNAELVSITTP